MGEQDGQQAKEARDQSEEARDQSGGDADAQEQTQGGDGQQQKQTEKPEPDDKAKEKASEMMSSYEDRPTLVLPGTGGAVSGTAVGEWLDDEGNPKALGDDDAPAAKADESADDKADESADDTDDESADDKKSFEEQIEEDKAFNAEVLKAAESDKPDDDEAKAKEQAAHQEKSVLR
jgi:hypothetical protein